MVRISLWLHFHNFSWLSGSALLWLADRETSGVGTIAPCLCYYTRAGQRRMPDFVVGVVPEQTSEQRMREVESASADAASVARLVRRVAVAATL